MGMTTEHTLDMVRLLLKHGATVYQQHKVRATARRREARLL